MMTVDIFTDGACRGNPGPGGWAALLRYGQTEKILTGHHEDTTNNRMELSAVIYALQALTKPCHVILTTDSQYVQKGITTWLISWQKKHWQKSTGGFIKNHDLWQTIPPLLSRHHVECHWVRGHDGHRDNERVDQLARQAIVGK